MVTKNMTFGEALEAIKKESWFVVKDGMGKACLFFSVLKIVCLRIWS